MTLKQRRSATSLRRPLVTSARTLVLSAALVFVPVCVGHGAITEFSSDQPAHIVATPTTDLQKRVTQRLADYLGRVLGRPTQVVATVEALPVDVPAIVLLSGKDGQAFDIATPTASPEAFVLQTRTLGSRTVVVAFGSTDQGLKHAVQRLIVQSAQRPDGVVIPDLKQSESPWVAQREWTLCPWGPELVRGYFVNPHVDPRSNVWRYSDQQMSDYVAMFDAFGFSGCQLMETVLGYAVVGSAQGYRDRLRKFANAASAAGQDVTLWVWAAQFNDYGWFDPNVTYTPAKGTSAFEDRDVRATFERYYDGYAELAPHVDLLIAHFYDPGQLKDRADVFRYTRLLFEKFKSKNPEVRLGVDFWAAGSDSDYMKQLVNNGFGDALLLQNTMPHLYPPGKRERLHEEAKKHNISMGVWGWYTAEMESDQRPSMHVNARLLSDFYRTIKDGVHQIHPIAYWSEMEAYHLNNVFTMYAASQLLWNPSRDPDEILAEITDGMYGPRNGPKVLEALQLIQDARSGPTWDTYWWTTRQFRLGTDDPEGDVRRADAAIAKLEAMTVDETFVSKFPLPFPPMTFVELTLPHLRQIRHFAAFRLKHAAVQEAAKQGAPKQDLAKLVQAAWDPVPEFNTWIGAFGQPEAVMQETMIMQLAKDLGVEARAPMWMRWRDAERQLQAMQNSQRARTSPYRFKLTANTAFNWTAEKTRDRFQLLIDNHCVEKVGEDVYQLANWEHFRQR